MRTQHITSPKQLSLWEEWRPVVGYEGLYEVSNLGQVRRVSGKRGTWAGKILRPGIASHGYPTVALTDHKAHMRSWPLHMLVAYAFLGPRPNGHQVNHKDANRKNPCLANLEYITPSANLQYAHDLGAFRHAKYAHGEQSHKSTLTDDAVRDIRASGVSLRLLAQRYHVHTSTIHSIKRRKTWAHIA